MEIKAVLFDCDGLMFDTEIIATQIWRDEALARNVKLPDDFFERITGAGGKDLAAYFDSLPAVSQMLGEMHEKRFDLAFWRSIHTDCLNRPGLIELSLWLDRNHYLKAVCSSSAKEYVTALIGTVSVPLKFDTIICGDMVAHAKPDPEIFLTAAKQLDVMPQECLVLEDSKQGILAAANAGMHSCFIPDTIIPDEEMERAIEFRAETLSDVIGLLEKMKEK